MTYENIEKLITLLNRVETFSSAKARLLAREPNTYELTEYNENCSIIKRAKHEIFDLFILQEK